MKVCFLAGTLGRGGAERQLLFMLRALLQANISTRVLCLTEGDYFEREIQDLGLPIDWVGTSHKKVSRALSIIQNLKQKPADILQSVHFYTNIYAGIAGRACHIPSIGAIRSDFRNEMSAHRLLGRWQLALPTHLIANTRLARERAIQYGITPDKIDYLGNAVETSETVNLNGSNDSSSSNILFVGRLVNLKRPDLFIKLASLLEQQLPHLKLNFQVVGDGPLRAQLERLARDLNLKQNQVTFLGWQSEMTEIYGRADVLVLTSEYEGAPNVLLEAMAYGVPIVATEVGGVREILDNTRGILIQPNNLPDLAEAVKKLISNGEMRDQLGIQGRKYVIENHSLEDLKTQLNEIYRKLLK